MAPVEATSSSSSSSQEEEEQEGGDDDVLATSSSASPGSTPSVPGVGCQILGEDGGSWGLVVGETKTCWRLADGRVARKSNAGRRWRWAFAGEDAAAAAKAAVAGAGACQAEALPRAPLAGPAAACPERAVDLVAPCVFEWLSLASLMRSSMACKAWAASLCGRAPIGLPPPQMDAMLRFCLLDFLVRFDDERLPLPISAVYGEMRAAGRRAAGCPASRSRLEALVCRALGPSCKAQQESFLRERRPHHVLWEAEVKKSSFKNVEKMARSFHGERFIEATFQIWRKRIHHSPNTRTCKEWLLTRVRRDHPLFVEHAAWSLTLPQPPAVAAT